jgi:hypothetical protein
MSSVKLEKLSKGISIAQKRAIEEGELLLKSTFETNIMQDKLDDDRYFTLQTAFSGKIHVLDQR